MKRFKNWLANKLVSFVLVNGDKRVIEERLLSEVHIGITVNGLFIYFNTIYGAILSGRLTRFGEPECCIEKGLDVLLFKEGEKVSRLLGDGLSI